MVDTVGDRLPNDDVHAGNEGEITPQVRQELLLGALAHLETHVDLRCVNALSVLVQLGTARPAGSRRDFGLPKEDLLDHAPEFVRLLERCPRHGYSADGQRPFVEVRQERLTRAEKCSAGSDEGEK